MIKLLHSGLLAQGARGDLASRCAYDTPGDRGVGLPVAVAAEAVGSFKGCGEEEGTAVRDQGTDSARRRSWLRHWAPWRPIEADGGRRWRSYQVQRRAGEQGQGRAKLNNLVL